MYSVWTKHLRDERHKEEFRQSVRGSKQVLERLGEILDDMDKEINSKELSTDVYDKPNWDYRQAHTNGMRSSIKMIKQLINLDQKD